MNPNTSSPYWTQELPVLEAPDGGDGGNNEAPGNVMMSTNGPAVAANHHHMQPQVHVQQQQAPIHPGQMRPINAANGYAVSSDFVGNGGMAPSPPPIMSPVMMSSSNSSNNNSLMPDAAGHHHYDQHHREAQWPGAAVAAMQQQMSHMSINMGMNMNGVNGNHHPHPPSTPSNNSPPMQQPPPTSANNPNPYSSPIPVGQVVPSPYGGGYHHGYYHGHDEDDDYYHNGHYYHPNDDNDDSPNSRGSRGGHHHHHGNNKYNKKKGGSNNNNKPSLRNPALRSAYWRLKLSLLATSSDASANTAATSNIDARQHPQDRTNNKNKNPFTARDMANPTKAEAWLAAIGAAESMAQKKNVKTTNSNNNGRMNKKKNQHRGGHHHHHNRRREDHRGSRGGTNDTTTDGEVGSIDNKLLAAGYLKHLFHQLSDDKAHWDGPPRFHPTIPKWDEEGIHQATLIVENMPGVGTGMGNGEHYDMYHDEEDHYDDPYLTPNHNNRHRGGRSGGGNGNNRYSVFGDDDDEDSSDDEENTYGGRGGRDFDGHASDDAKSTAQSGGSDTSSTGDLSEEEIVYHGDHAAANHRSKSKGKVNANFDPTDTAQMATRRIVVRVLAALGDIHGVIGIDHSRAKPIPRWVLGASQYAFAFRSLTIGQELLDGQYAQMLQAEEEEEGAVGDDKGDGPSPPTPRTKERLDKLKAALATDSEIIAVSLTSFARNRERYLNAAKSRIDFLQSRLLEDKESREQAFQGMGEDRWNNNPTPRCTYSERRKKMERELHQAKEGSERVSKLETPAKKKVLIGDRNANAKKSSAKAKVPEGVVVEV